VNELWHAGDPVAAMLERFTVKNFKSFREATLSLRPLTVLIGANASGKTNLLEAL
jgi:AAA15 family ATPase/GTPase